MQRYPRIIQYLVLCLAFLYAFAGGHFLCAHSVSHLEHQCDQTHHQTPKDHSPSCCCPVDSGGQKHRCHSQPVIIVHRGVKESTNSLQNPYIAFVSVFPEEGSPGTSSLHDANVVSLSVPPVRLHLLYRSLLI